ncbi:MAG TPA: serine/threonine-protein kinase [Bryobacteraceae bacterium]|nr:serine/threonine-protein kinase [Bryobacteraceae bacterium]
MSFQAGDKVGDYQVLAVLGAGGMGQVYKVRNAISDRIEAMKILLPNLEADPDLADRFLREIKVQATLDHPNIAALHTAQRVDNQIVMVMEYVEGTTLEKLLEHGPIPLASAVDCVCQVLSALAYAHARGVIHRDIKPANMMLTPAGTVKLMDFGIARMTADRRLTQTGKTVGSLFYMSPEQIQGATELDARSDLYSLGVSLYELVTGRRPFQGDSDYSIMAAHLQQNPVPPIQLDPNVPSALNEIILTSIAKEPAQRFQSADALHTALSSVAGLMGVTPSTAELTQKMNAPAPAPPAATAPVAAQPAAPVPVTKTSGSRRGLYMAIGAVAALVVLALAVTQGPKFMRTRASNGSATPQSVQTQPQVQPAQIPEIAPGPAASPAAADVAPSTPATQNSAPPAAKSSPQPAPKHTALHRQASQPIAEQPPTQTVTTQPANPSPPVADPPAAPAPDPARARELERLRDQYNQMSIRAGSVKSGMRSMEAQMARSGLGMRGDMKNTESRMDYLMQEAMSSIQNGDTAGAKKNLDTAEFALEALEQFLNR